MFWVLFLSLLNTDLEATDATMRFVQDDSNIILLWPCHSDCWADCGPDEPDDEYLPANVTKVCCLDEDSSQCCFFDPKQRDYRQLEQDHRRNQASRERILRIGGHVAFVIGLLQSMCAVLYYTGLYHRHCRKPLLDVIHRLHEHFIRIHSSLSMWTAAIVNRCGNLRFRKEDVTSAPEQTPHKPRVESKLRVENTCNKHHVDSCTRALLENLGGKQDVDDLILKLYFTQGDNLGIDEARRMKKENARRNRKGH